MRWDGVGDASSWSAARWRCPFHPIQDERMVCSRGAYNIKTPPSGLSPVNVLPGKPLLNDQRGWSSQKRQTTVNCSQEMLPRKTPFRISRSSPSPACTINRISRPDEGVPRPPSAASTPPQPCCGGRGSWFASLARCGVGGNRIASAGSSRNLGMPRTPSFSRSRQDFHAKRSGRLSLDVIFNFTCSSRGSGNIPCSCCFFAFWDSRVWA
ncbi:hypothetical protein B0T18DRAFT_26442 [Schizothecium vesticola]|uniref:Uncharacterized protein n=1 Tax=Schizothecium vesticola TaxID=314040 RepID=A0AA40FB14_9PEZI|nr:hypothetical protein B0T18DRAFT_26442 [Schizothecium vesticola]